MFSRNKDIFVYSSYWRTWSRVLLRMGGKFNYQLEVDVTPINEQYKESWEQTKNIRIRRHCTVHGPRDIYTHDLPDEVVESMKEHISQETIDVILHSDLYNMIDWERFDDVHNAGGGGVHLLDCIKTITPIFRLGYANDQGSDIINGDVESFSNKLKEDFGREINNNERLVTGWIEIQSQGTVCIYITRDKVTEVSTTHFIVRDGNTQYYVNAFMVKFPSDWYYEIKGLVDQLLGEYIDKLEIRGEVDTYVDQAKLILEYDMLWELV
ncbi:hypothetical protein PQC65_gp194 [Aeromonas phage pAEv1810]|uniref:hypothetical protein n=1 Tax=Aeromonas phage pAEv1810 TaxID=2908744 RepID=UPI002329110B|nr:hypothetical protein PQC65_gp194 [Aeromonas phage pAEv1810]UIS25132.1 hypothetical protein pAEv1810_194 [Aeromonas phage pAEv1810]